MTAAPFDDWDETAAEVAPAVGQMHRPRVEDLGYGKGEALVCRIDDEPWPCTYERDLAREET